MSMVAENLELVRARLERACEACGRDSGGVELVAVSKKKDVETVREAVNAGQLLLGENRIQEVLVKQPELPGNVRWHLIGHLQSNKVKQAVHCRFECIHSVDSEKILLALDKESAEQGRVQPLLLQVNISGEASKSGLEPDALIPLLETAAGCMHVEVDGLMTIPPLTREPADAARFFAGLRELRDRAAAASGFELSELSMGMSRDMEVAIREGATLVRVGTDIFGARN